MVFICENGSFRLYISCVIMLWCSWLFGVSCMLCVIGSWFVLSVVLYVGRFFVFCV